MSVRAILLVLSTVLLIGCTAPVSKKKSSDFDRSKNSKADVYVQLGVQYLAKGQLQTALQNLENALRIDPENSEAHNAIAVLYERLEEPGRALRHFQKAVSLRPSNGSAQNNFGRLLCSQGDYDKADRHFRKAYETRLYRRPWIALTNAGRCARQKGDLDSADKYLRRALDKRPEFPPALFELAQLNFDTDEHFKVRAFLQRFSSVAKHTSKSLWIGVQSEQALGDGEAANQYRKLLLERFPESEEARLMELASPN